MPVEDSNSGQKKPRTKTMAKRRIRSGTDKRRLKAILRQMAWNDFAVPLEEVINGQGLTPSRRRFIE